MLMYSIIPDERGARQWASGPTIAMYAVLCNCVRSLFRNCKLERFKMDVIDQDLAFRLCFIDFYHLWGRVSLS